MSILTMMIILQIFSALYFLLIFIFSFGLFRRKKKGGNEELLRYSILIPARNEAENIRTILSSIHALDYPQDKYEVIVIDDHSIDQTYQLACQYKKTMPELQVIRVNERQRGVSSKKNALITGIMHAQYEIIATTDADCVVPPAWLSTINREFMPHVGAVYSLCYLDKIKDTFFNKFQSFDFLSLFSIGIAATGWGWHFAVSGSNFFYRKKTYTEAGGYGSISHIVAGDDDLFAQRIATKTNWKISYCHAPAAYVYSKPPQSINGFFKQKKRWASKIRYWRASMIAVGSFYYLVNLAIIVAFAMYFIDHNVLYLLLPMTKFVIDCYMYSLGLWKIKRQKMLWIYPLWAIINIPYVLIMSIAGQIGGIKWKGIDYQSSNIKVD